jgi:aldose 1-epimerase
MKMNEAALRPQQLVALAAGELRLVLAPEVGGSIASFTRYWREGRRRRELHWLRPATANGLASRNPLHGIAWLQPWQVDSASADRCEMSLQIPASQAWPWRFSSRQQFVLKERVLEVTMAVTNEDTAAMPAGIGHHPYFPHHRGTRLTSTAEAMWRGDAEVMPVSLEQGGPVTALREGVELAALDLDNNFVGWQHSTRIDWPADLHGPARRLVMEAESPLDYFVLYCPTGYDYFCAEPVSQCTDWLNLLPRYGREAVGGARLAPGESLQASFSLTPAWL